MSVQTGLVFLGVSVVCSVAVGALLKAGRARGLDVRQAIFMNYVVASSLCAWLLRPDIPRLFEPGQPWGIFLALGVLLPSVFLLLARSLHEAGLARTDAAQRLSLIIPLLAAFVWFGEPLTARKLLGVGLALGAMACLLTRSGRGGASKGHGTGSWIWPLTVLLGYGVIDILFKQMAKAGAAFPGGLLAAFALAGVLMLGYLAVVRVRWGAGHLLAGVLLGGLNFANIYTYIRAHQSLPGNPALVFSSMNMGVIVGGTLLGAWAFREPLGRLNWLGVALALGAIGAMMPA